MEMALLGDVTAKLKYTSIQKNEVVLQAEVETGKGESSLLH